MENTNDVWSTLRGITGDIGNLYLRDQEIKATTQRANATAAPIAPAPANLNPFAGMWSAYPQNDTKGQNTNPTPWSFATAINPLWLVLIGLVGVLFFLRK